MANVFKVKQSSVSAKVPTTAQLALGELAINTTDGRLYFKKNVSGTESIVDVLASGVASNVSGVVAFANGGTNATTAAAALTSLGAYAANNPSGYTANAGTVTSVAALTLGTVGTDVGSSVAGGTMTPVITLNIPTASAANRGALSAADWATFNGKQAAGTYASGTGSASGTNTGDNSANSLYSGLVTNVTHTGDVTGSTVLSLASIITAGGPTGSNSAVPVITYDDHGRLTAVTTATITPAAIGAQVSGSYQAAGTYATGTGTASGTNTGDETAATIKAKLSITTLSGSNTGDQTLPTTLPASDVYAWAKAATKPSYTNTELGAQAAGSYATGTGSASGTNTGDNAANTLYSGLVSNASHTGDATGSTALTLASVITAAGPVGSTSVVPVITFDAKGRLTTVTTATITPAAIGAQAAGSYQAAGTYASGTGTASGTNTGDQTLPTTLPASDVYAWAKTATKPSYTPSELGLGSVNNTADSAKSVSYAATAGAAPANGGTSAACSGNAATVTNASFYRQFTVRDDRSDGSDYSLAARPTGLYAMTGAGTNGPGATYQSLIHLANGSDVAFQIAGGYQSDNMYFRGTSALQNGTGYSAWRTVVHSGNIASQSVAYATTAGAAPASDVSAWAKAGTKPGYTYAEVGAQVAGSYQAALGFTPYNATNPSGFTSNAGTVTSVAATAPVASSGGAAPSISMAAATALVDGYMTSTFATKLNGIAAGATANTGILTGVTGTAPVVSSGGTAPAISMAAATGSVAGYLSAADWTTFNGKQAAGSYQAAGTYASGTGSASGTNTGDNAANTLYSGLVSNATHTGDLTGSTALTLASVITAAGPIGSTSVVPVITFDAKGRLTAVTTANITPAAIGAYAATNPSGYTTNTGTVTGVTATAPVASSGGTAPVISMAAASAGVNGYMTGAYATKLDGIAAGATTNTGTVTGVTGTSPVVSSGGTAPAISMAAATTAVAGYLTAADWGTFNGKQAALGFTPYNATNPSGYTANTGTVTGVTGTAPVVSSGGAAPAISMAAASTLVAGYLTAADWTNFNGKQAALGFTPYNATNPSGYIPLSSVTDAVVTGKVLTGYVAGTNAALAASDTVLAAMAKIQGQITARSGTVTSVGGTGTVSGLTLTGTVTASGSLTLGGTLALGALATTGTSGGLTGTPAITVGAITSTTITASGAITSTGNVTAFFSDDRLKTRLGPIENALDKIDTLDTFYYEPNETAQLLGYEPVRDVGLSAQQVQAVMPEVVAPAPIDAQYLTVRYERLLALSFAAIKELRQEVNELKGAK